MPLNFYIKNGDMPLSYLVNISKIMIIMKKYGDIYPERR